MAAEKVGIDQTTKSPAMRIVMVSDEKLREEVNRSGFPLQIAVEHTVSSSHDDHGWRVFSKEHSWKNDETGSSGFIDLLLIDHFETSILVVECKRVINSHWIFLNPAENINNRNHAKTWITCSRGEQAIYFDWLDIAINPSTPESEFCVVPGQDNRSKPMLERVAAELVEATEGFAREDIGILKDGNGDLRFYTSVIITTAEIQVCTFSPSSISLGDGTLNESEFQTEPYLRFRKQLSANRKRQKAKRHLDPGFSMKENTIFIVNSEHLIEFLREYEVDDKRLMRDLHGLF